MPNVSDNLLQNLVYKGCFLDKKLLVNAMLNKVSWKVHSGREFLTIGVRSLQEGGTAPRLQSKKSKSKFMQ